MTNYYEGFIFNFMKCIFSKIGSQDPLYIITGLKENTLLTMNLKYYKIYVFLRYTDGLIKLLRKGYIDI